ncbi:MAG TPA: hypothetical protein PK567_00940 [Bacillota bacterium]|nr:hypothetical protein [Bacillota bacterium]
MESKKINAVNCFLICTILVIIYFGSMMIINAIIKGAYPNSIGTHGFLVTLVFCMVSIVLYNIQLVLHELGHLFAGLISGYSFISFRVYNTVWIKKNGKLAIKKYKLTGTAGQCLMKPPLYQENGKNPINLYQLGGVLMNMLCAGIFGGLCLLPIAPISRAFFITAAAMALIPAVINGIPFSGKMLNNDGANILACKRNPLMIRVFYTQMITLAEYAEDARMKDIDEANYFFPTEKEMTTAIITTQYVNSCCYYIINGRLDEAYEKLKWLHNHTEIPRSGIIGAFIDMELTYLSLLTEQPKDERNSFLSKTTMDFIQKMKENPTVLRYQYAKALLEDNNTNDAQNIREQFESMRNTYPYQGEILDELELMNRVDEKYKEVQSYA